jgi:3-carboxymethyl-3-hydroxy-acyl-[acp] synthase
MNVGIEMLNVFGGTTFLDVDELARHRNLDMSRFDNLLMSEKAVALPYEDPITYAVNAAKPILDKLSDTEKDSIEMIITCTESGIDFGKSMSTYVHHYLGLSRSCRLFEIKQACYSGTAGYQMAVNFVLSNTSPGAKALVIATDISRFTVVKGGAALSEDWSFAEPSSGAGAVAMLVGNNPQVFQADVGANGVYGYEVMDTCRPVTDGEAGDSDLSLMSYLDCSEQAFKEYKKRVPEAHYKESFDYLSFHTPFGGMVKGAHRTMMRKTVRASPEQISADFHQRVVPGLSYCQRVGNIMGATVFLSLASTIDNGDFSNAKRIGCFSYGSGCCSEFYSGVVSNKAVKLQSEFDIKKHLDSRYKLNMSEYQKIIDASANVKFGTRNVQIDCEFLPEIWSSVQGCGRLYLKQINEYHRKYEVV